MRAVSLLFIFLFGLSLNAQLNDWYLALDVGVSEKALESSSLAQFNENGNTVNSRRRGWTTDIPSTTAYLGVSTYYRTRKRYTALLGLRYGSSSHTDNKGQGFSYNYDGQNHVISLEREREVQWLWVECLLLYSLFYSERTSFRFELGTGLTWLWHQQSYRYGQIYNLENSAFDRTIFRTTKEQNWGLPLLLRLSIPYGRRGEFGLSGQVNYFMEGRNQTNISIFGAYRLNQ
ncbi:MAG: hypothetical protein AAGF89_14515 [Bacteroidota bacterium]